MTKSHGLRTQLSENSRKEVKSKNGKVRTTELQRKPNHFKRKAFQGNGNSRKSKIQKILPKILEKLKSWHEKPTKIRFLSLISKTHKGKPQISNVS